MQLDLPLRSTPTFSPTTSQSLQLGFINHIFLLSESIGRQEHRNQDGDQLGPGNVLQMTDLMLRRYGGPFSGICAPIVRLLTGAGYFPLFWTTSGYFLRSWGNQATDERPTNINGPAPRIVGNLA